MWNPDVYLAFADHRGRPVLRPAVAGRRRRPAARRRPRLWSRQPDRHPGAALARRGDRGRRQLTGDGRGRAWSAVSTPSSATSMRGHRRPDTDVVVSNAALQWVPDHAELVVRWAGELAAGAWIAVSGAGQLRRAVARRGAGGRRRAPFADAVARHAVPRQARSSTPRAIRGDPDRRRLHRRRLGDHLHPRAHRRDTGAGLDHRHRAHRGEEPAVRRGVAAVPSTS